MTTTAARAYDARQPYTCACTHAVPCAGCVEHNALFAALTDAERAHVEAQIAAGAPDALAATEPR